jgi:hypothetical protein
LTKDSENTEKESITIKHPLGKAPENDPLVIAIEVRNAFMNGEIQSSKYKTAKQNIKKHVDQKYKHLAEIKRKEIVSLVNDGYGHGGKRK